MNTGVKRDSFDLLLGQVCIQAASRTIALRALGGLGVARVGRDWLVSPERCSWVALCTTDNLPGTLSAVDAAKRGTKLDLQCMATERDAGMMVGLAAEVGLLKSAGMAVEDIALCLGALQKAGRLSVNDPVLRRPLVLADVAACYGLLSRSWHLVERECDSLLEVALALPDIGAAELASTLPSAVLIIGRYVQIE